MASFEAQVDAWVAKSQKRLLAVFQTATQFVVEDVIARTPVDTGYLRASFSVNLKYPLPLRGARGDGFVAPPYSLVIAGAASGDTIYATFVASYAPHLEYGAQGRSGASMVKLSVQKWQYQVNKAALAAQARYR